MTNASRALDPNLTVAETLERWPQLVPILLRRRMACAGCDVAPFETLAQAAGIYHLDLAVFLTELGEAIQGTGA